MTTGLYCDLNISWDHSIDGTLETDQSKGLQLVRQYLCYWTFANIFPKVNSFDQSTETAGSFPESNSRYLPSYLSPFDHNRTLMSGSSASSSRFDRKIPASYSPTATWDQSAMSCAAEDSSRSFSRPITTSDSYGSNHCEIPRGQSFSTNHAPSPGESVDAAYESWQSIRYRHTTEVGYQASYEFTVEELNQIEDLRLASAFVSPANPTDVRSYLLHSTEPTRLQSQGGSFDNSNSLSPDIEATLLPSPVSSDDESPRSGKSIIARMNPPCQKSTIRAKIPHSTVEKRYRSKLDSKMIELQQCVPILHIKTKNEDCCVGPDFISTTSPKQDGKLPKCLILDRAAGYIRSLEARASEQDTHVELLERRLAVLQRIALDKMKGAVSGLVTTDRKDKTHPEVKESPSTSNAVPLPTIRGSKSPNAISSQPRLDAGPKRSRRKVEKEHSSDFEMDGVSPPAKHRKVSRSHTS